MFDSECRPRRGQTTAGTGNLWRAVLRGSFRPKPLQPHRLNTCATASRSHGVIKSPADSLSLLPVPAAPQHGVVAPRRHEVIASSHKVTCPHGRFASYGTLLLRHLEDRARLNAKNPRLPDSLFRAHWFTLSRHRGGRRSKPCFAPSVLKILSLSNDRKGSWGSAGPSEQWRNYECSSG